MHSTQTDNFEQSQFLFAPQPAFTQLQNSQNDDEKTEEGDDATITDDDTISLDSGNSPASIHNGYHKNGIVLLV